MTGTASEPGIIQRTFVHLFELIAASTKRRHIIYVTFMELYNEEVLDLLPTKTSDKPLDIREVKGKGFMVANVSRHPVASIQDLQRLMLSGNKRRATGETLMNA